MSFISHDSLPSYGFLFVTLHDYILTASRRVYASGSEQQREH